MNGESLKPAGVWLARLFGCLLVVSGTAGATSVRQLSLEELVQGAELVFDGRVVDIATHSLGASSAGQGGLVYTTVTFEILDLVKGEYAQPTLTLSFLGGSAGGRSLVIEEMRLPASGERGIYFVETLARRQVHPLYGWSQGHFLVVSDPALGERVMTADSQTITGVEPAPAKQPNKFSKGVVKGLVLESAAALSQAMTPEQFKRTLRDMLQQGDW
jgi:hypothetical protein